LAYLLGCLAFGVVDHEHKPRLGVEAALMFSIGGLCLLTSASYLHKRYFWERSSVKLSAEEGEMRSIDL
jgi:hypothetical protein